MTKSFSILTAVGATAGAAAGAGFSLDGAPGNETVNYTPSLPLTTTYTTSGAIAVTDLLSSIYSTSTVLAMTLGAGSTDGHELTIVNYGLVGATVALTLNSLSVTIGIQPKQVLSFAWNVAAASWVGTSTLPGCMPLTYYSASGAISVTDQFVLMAGGVAMTLGNGPYDGHTMFFNNYGAASSTVTLQLGGVAGTVITLTAGQCFAVQYTVAGTNWLKIVPVG